METNKEQVIKLIQHLLSNGLPDQAKDTLKKWGLDKQYKIENGALIDLTNATATWLDRFITVNATMLELKEDVKKLSQVDDPVLITGETGTGKELIARALHGKREGKFQSINCAGLPEELIESELFGHKAGAFTGALRDKEGLMQIATKGTMFLDEVGELPLQAQAKLLRAIQQKEIRRVGDSRDIEIDCRIVCATNCDLQDMVERKLFRIDLYARISTFELHIQNLKERADDIEPILLSMAGGKELIKYMNDLEAKEGNDFPHEFDVSLNVRSLERMVKRFKVLGKI